MKSIFTIEDSETGEFEDITVTSKNMGQLLIRPEGYGDKTSNDGEGFPILIEKIGGEFKIYVWSDINKEDPTHSISLEGARETLRGKTDSDKVSIEALLKHSGKNRVIIEAIKKVVTEESNYVLAQELRNTLLKLNEKGTEESSLLGHEDVVNTLGYAMTLGCSGFDVAAKLSETTGKTHWYLGDSIWTSDPNELVGKYVVVSAPNGQFQGKVHAYSKERGFTIVDQEDDAFDYETEFITEVVPF